MLVLTRKRHDRVVIANNVELTVLEIRGNRVKIGFSAPQEVVIERAELSHGLLPAREREEATRDASPTGRRQRAKYPRANGPDRPHD